MVDRGRSRVRRGSVVAALAGVGALVAMLTAAPASAAVAGQWWLSKLSVTKANRTSTGTGVTVAVLDSGVSNTLGDLRGQVLAGKQFVGSGGPHADPGSNCDQNGCYSHGTQMALEIAGTGKGAGFRGVAPGAKILPLKVDSSTADHDGFAPITTAAAIRYAVDQHVGVISMSFGGSGTCGSDEASAVRYAYQHGVIMLAGAGNDGDATVQAPANCPGVLGISGADPNYRIWQYSNTGPQIAFACAYGGVQERLSGKILRQTDPNAKTGFGTSDATAVAAGVVALLRSHYPHDSARMIITRLIAHSFVPKNAPPVGHRINDQFGYGIMGPYTALTKTTPANSPNPIYDAFDKELGSSSAPPSSRAPSSATAPPASTAPAPAENSSSSSPGGAIAAPSQGDSSSGGSNSGIIIAVIVIVVVLLLAAGVLIARSRRSRIAGGPPVGGTWPPQGPPPQGPPPQGPPPQGPPPQGPPPQGPPPQGPPPQGPPPTGPYGGPPNQGPPRG